MRIALIEDHLMMRDILRKACALEAGYEVVAECDRGKGAVAALARRPADLVVLDLQLPDCDGLELIAALRSAPAAPAVLVLSSRCDAFTVFQLERAEIAGFIDKGSQTVAMLGYALRAIAEGRRYFSPVFTRVRQDRLLNPRSFDKVLSDREQVVLACLGDCCSDRETAERLGISPQTAQKHRFNLMRKLNLDSMAAAIRFAQANGFYFARIKHRL
ncbi:MAG TPA: response regulator transcription factor [Opitutaceae bacterium]|jgi:DNA-binding NarL/FixJ family response regulator|nr:response regulator transcription factor [Opitutaceae bacterium]